MRALVTGGAGFIGSHLCDALLADGHEVHVLDDLSTGSADQVSANAELHVLDLRDGMGTNACLRAVQPQLVFHLAAQPSVLRSVRGPAEDATVNVIGSINLLESCREAAVKRVVFASTGGAIYGEVQAGRANIDAPLRPMNPYGIAKQAVEAYLRYYRVEHGLASSALRLANVYGARQNPAGEAGVIAIFAERFRRGEDVQVHARNEKGDGGCIRDYVHVHDAAQAFIRLAHGPLKPKAQLGSGVGTTTREIAELVRDALGAHGCAIRPAARRIGDLRRVVLEPDEPCTIPLGEGLRALFKDG